MIIEMIRLVKNKQNSKLNKTKMKTEEPPGGREYDNNRSNNYVCIRDSRRYLNHALLSIRGKITGTPGVISHDFDNFVKLLCD